MQKGSIKEIPRPKFKQNNFQIAQRSDLSPIPTVSPLEFLSHSSQSKKFFPPPKKFSKEFSNSLIESNSQPTSPKVNKDEGQKFSQTKSNKGNEFKVRRFTEGNKKGEKSNLKRSEDIIETLFQGVERIEHMNDEIHEFPKFLILNTQEPTNHTTTILDRSGFDLQNKSIDLIENYEKPFCKTVIQYTFQSKKLGGDYTIKSTDLFNDEEFKIK